uniref:Uncharacterized protein n=1 Tax=Octopus bimaculoides TaxID=37653 RepID=A0A0L8HEG4_OCTBM
MMNVKWRGLPTLAQDQPEIMSNNTLCAFVELKSSGKEGEQLTKEMMREGEQHKQSEP